ncbi:MAG: DUF3263 domain-containing protein [Candidatus Nanopelagicales bacterium]|nr:DUF3263 domain-containing protein [Candidatus Nanopelagicales bacterium]
MSSARVSANHHNIRRNGLQADVAAGGPPASRGRGQHRNLGEQISAQVQRDSTKDSLVSGHADRPRAKTWPESGLNNLIDNPAALSADPVLVRRLRRLRASRNEARTSLRRRT